LRVVARARELVDLGTSIETSCRLILLEDQLEEAQRANAEYRRAAGWRIRRPRPETTPGRRPPGTAHSPRATVPLVTGCAGV
jgi:hypothetical protein